MHILPACDFNGKILILRLACKVFRLLLYYVHIKDTMKNVDSGISIYFSASIYLYIIIFRIKCMVSAILKCIFMFLGYRHCGRTFNIFNKMYIYYEIKKAGIRVFLMKCTFIMKSKNRYKNILNVVLYILIK